MAFHFRVWDWDLGIFPSRKPKTNEVQSCADEVDSCEDPQESPMNHYAEDDQCSKPSEPVNSKEYKLEMVWTLNAAGELNCNWERKHDKTEDEPNLPDAA